MGGGSPHSTHPAIAPLHTTLLRCNSFAARRSYCRGALQKGRRSVVSKLRPAGRFWPTSTSGPVPWTIPERVLICFMYVYLYSIIKLDFCNKMFLSYEIFSLLTTSNNFIQAYNELSAMTTGQPTQAGKPAPLLLIWWCHPGTITIVPAIGDECSASWSLISSSSWVPNLHKLARHRPLVVLCVGGRQCAVLWGFVKPQNVWTARPQSSNFIAGP